MKRILCGPRAVEEAIKGNPAEINLILFDPSNRHHLELLTAAEKKKVQAQPGPRESLDLLSGELKHQGIIAITGEYPYIDLDRLLTLSTKPPRLFVALDQVQDVHNAGSILRSSVALGVDGVILCRHNAAKITAAAVRVSAGASEHALVARVTNLANSISTLKEQGFSIVGLDASGDRALEDLDLTTDTVLVMGSEGSGMRRLVRESCDFVASIPLHGPISSLNVGVACGIAIYEVSRQRRKKT